MEVTVCPPSPLCGRAFSTLDIPLPIPGTLAGAGILQELGQIGHQRGRWRKEACEQAEDAPAQSTVLSAGQSWVSGWSTTVLGPPESPTYPTSPTHGWGCPVTCLMTWQYISSLRSSWHSCRNGTSEWVRQRQASRAQGAVGSDGCLRPE